MDRLKKNNDDSRIDYGVILPVFLLCLIGMLSLYVALTHDTIRDPNVFRGLAMQAIWYVVGALAVVIIIHLDAKLLWRLTPFLYVIGLAVMLALLKYYDPALAASTGSKTGSSLVHLHSSHRN